MKTLKWSDDPSSAGSQDVMQYYDNIYGQHIEIPQFLFFKKTCLKSLRLLNGVKSERKECERVEKRVTDINIYRWGCQTAATTVSLWLWMRSTGRKNQIKLEIKWILPQVTNIKYTSNKHICKVHSRGIFLSCVAYSMDIYSRKPCVCISASVFG